MAEDSSEVKELYGRGLDGKLWVMNGRLMKKEVKKEEEEEAQMSSGKGIEKAGEMASGDKGKENDASSVSNLPSQPSSFSAIIHPLNDQPQLSLQAEEGHATANGGDSLLDELQHLKDALKSKELLNSMLMAKLEQVRKEKNEEQRKNAKLVEELQVAKEKSNNTDKETETEATTLQPLRAAIAAQLLGIEPQPLDEPQPNEWKEKFDQLNVKYSKVKRLYRSEQKVAAKLRKKLKDSESGGTIEDNEEAPSLAHLGVADQVEERFESTEVVVSSPMQNKHHLRQQQMDVEEENGDEGRAQKQGPPVAAHHLGNYKCAQCPPDRLAFSTGEQLVQHQQRRHTVRQHYRDQCADCGLACLNSAHLRNHMRTHTGEKPHQCLHCGKEFALKGNLTRHERVHTGERPFVCTVCQKAFADSSALIRHDRLHSGETPYSCQYCARKFTDASLCRYHESSCPKRK